MNSQPPDRRTAVGATVGSLAELLLVDGADGDRFTTRAREKSKHLSADDLPALRSLIHAPPEQSARYDPTTHGLGGWVSCCQFAIFELVYNLGQEALPFVREIAWGQYDWTQGNAIEVLIRLAAAGIATDEIIEEIETEFPKIRDEAGVYAIKPLLGRLDTDADLKRIFDRLMAIEEFKDTYDELTWVDPDPYNITRDHLHARVVASRATDYRVMNLRVIACLEAKDIRSSDFQDEGGRAQICITDDCALLKPGHDDVERIDLSALLGAEKIAIGHYSFKTFEDDITCIYPQSVALLR